MTEHNLRAYFTKQIKARNVYCIKYHGSAYGTRGVPDYLMCVSDYSCGRSAIGEAMGLFVSIELKEDAHPTPLQHDNMGRITALGGVAIVLTGRKQIEKFLQILDKYLERARLERKNFWKHLLDAGFMLNSDGYISLRSYMTGVVDGH